MWIWRCSAFLRYHVYDRCPQVDALIDSYFTEGCPQEVRTKIYAYIAVCDFCGATGVSTRAG